jgi:hypothetical protein
MLAILGRLNSEKNSTETISLDWVDRIETATVYVTGSSLDDLDKRTRLNSIIRAADPTRKVQVVVLQPMKPAAIVYDGRVVTSEEMNSFSEWIAARDEKIQYSLDNLDESRLSFEDSSSSTSKVNFETLDKIVAQQSHQKQLNSVLSERDEVETLFTCLSDMRKAAESIHTQRLAAVQLAADRRLSDGVPESDVEKWYDLQVKEIGDVTYRLPTLKESQRRIEVQHKSKLGFAPDLKAFLLSLWQKVRGQAPNCLQYAPVSCLTPMHVPKPMPDEKAAVLSKWTRGANKTRPNDLVSWYWLIVSWNNSKRGIDAVPLPKGSRNPYFRKAKEGPPKPGMTLEVKAALEELRETMGKFSALSFPEAPVSEDPVVILRELIAGMSPGPMRKYVPISGQGSWDALLERDASTRPMVERAQLIEISLKDHLLKEQSYQSRITELEEKVSFLHSQVVNTPADDGESVLDDGSHAPLPDMILEHDRLWVSDPTAVRAPIVGRMIDGAQYWTSTNYPAGSKGKERAEPPPVPTASKPKAANTKEPGKDQKTGQTPPKSQGDPLNSKNPLRVKGEPRTRLLPDDTVNRLRAALKVPTPTQVPKETWDSYTSKEKAKIRERSSLPRWAVAIVLENPVNLELIEQGRLTKDNFSKEKVASAKVNSQVGNRSQTATAAWTSLKSKFKGVGLFQNPSTNKEKAFKKAYDSLVGEFGKLPVLPKPKVKPGAKTSGAGLKTGLGELAPMIELIGALSKAFRP